MPFNVDQSSRYLNDILQQEGSLEPGHVVTLAGHIATALDQAHRWGLAHGNLDPQTILVVREGDDEWVRVWERGSGDGLTLHAARYSAPERLNHQSLDVSSDVYSLGAVLYELCCGYLPVVAATNDLDGWCLAHTGTLPRPLKLMRSEVPDHLAGLIMQCLHKNPLMRPQSMQEFLKALHAGPRLPRRTNTPPARALWQPAQLVSGALLLMGITGVALTFTRTYDVLDTDRTLLARAEAQAILGAPEHIGAALSKLERIAGTSTVIDRVRQRREEWSTGLLRRALRSAGKGNYANAIILASIIPRSAANYFEAQHHLETWYAGHDSLPLATGPLTTDGQAQVSLRLAQPQVPPSTSFKALLPLTAPSTARSIQILSPMTYSISTQTPHRPATTSTTGRSTASILKVASAPVNLSGPPAPEVAAAPANVEPTALKLKVATLPVSQTSSLSLLKPAPVPLTLEAMPTPTQTLRIFKGSALPLQP